MPFRNETCSSYKLMAMAQCIAVQCLHDGRADQASRPAPTADGWLAGRDCSPRHLRLRTRRQATRCRFPALASPSPNQKLVPQPLARKSCFLGVATRFSVARCLCLCNTVCWMTVDRYIATVLSGSAGSLCSLLACIHLQGCIEV